MRGEADTEIDPLKHPLAMFGLHRRTALLTGSSSGIGLALARGFLAAGARVVLNGRDPEKLLRAQQALEALAPASGMVSSHGFDVTDPDAIAAAVQALESKLGGIDILVANAGFPEIAPMGELTRDQFDRCYEVIQAGLFELVSRAWPSLIRSPHGRVITISTLNAHLFRPNYPTYPASAAAVQALRRA